MARPPKGKPLTLRPIRLDDDVWAECQRLGKEHGTINEGISAAFAALQIQRAQGRVMAATFNTPPPTQTILDDTRVIRAAVDAEIKEHNRRTFKGKRELRPKGDKQR